MEKLVWNSITNIQSKNYVCGYCGFSLASDKGWQAENLLDSRISGACICICHNCTQPTFLDERGNMPRQTPGVVFGNVVEEIPEKTVCDLYEEARRYTSAECYTAAVLCCRKLLMNIAVSKGAEEGKNFFYYVQFLADHHYVPPDAKDWVDHIRKKGNEANHEIAIMSSLDAEELETVH